MWKKGLWSDESDIEISVEQNVMSYLKALLKRDTEIISTVALQFHYWTQIPVYQSSHNHRHHHQNLYSRVCHSSSEAIAITAGILISYM